MVRPTIPSRSRRRDDQRKIQIEAEAVLKKDQRY
jgi:hypothetical protein